MLGHTEGAVESCTNSVQGEAVPLTIDEQPLSVSKGCVADSLLCAGLAVNLLLANRPKP